MGAAVLECESAVAARSAAAGPADGSPEKVSEGGHEAGSGFEADPGTGGGHVPGTAGAGEDGDPAEHEDTAGRETARRRIVAELGHTHHQFGDLVARSVPDDAERAAARETSEEALGHLTRAIAVFDSLGDALLDARTGAELAACRLEADLGRREAAEARARVVIAACERLDGKAAKARRSEAERMRDLMERAEGA
jgi:hypothetical protein